MAKINRQEPLKELQDGLRLDTAREKTPLEVADKVLPVFNINPQRLVSVNTVNIVDTTPGTAHTVSATKRTFLVGAYLVTSKDVVNTSINSQIVATLISGRSIVILELKYEPLTLGQFSQYVTFPPIELSPGTLITTNVSNALASIDSRAIVYFFEVEN